MPAKVCAASRVRNVIIAELATSEGDAVVILQNVVAQLPSSYAIVLRFLWYDVISDLLSPQPVPVGSAKPLHRQQNDPA